MQFLHGVLDHRRKLTHDVFEIDIALEKPLSFTLGQFITLRLPLQDKYILRSYSLASSPQHQNMLTLCVKRHEFGLGSRYLNSLSEGERLDFLGPFGDLFHYDDTRDAFHFFATGTGIAPFMPIFEMLLKTMKHISFFLYFGVRTQRDIFYQDILDLYQRNYDNFSYQIYLSQEDMNVYYSGRVTDALHNIDMNKKNEFFLCGVPQMISEVQQFLTLHSVDPQYVHIEKW